MKPLFSTSKKKVYFFLLVKAIILLLFFSITYSRIIFFEEGYLEKSTVASAADKEIVSAFISMKNTLLILILFTVIFTAFGIYFLHQTLFKPIHYITTALEKRSVKCIKTLRTIPGEFSKIGHLLQEENNNNYLLVQAKLKAEESVRLKSTFLENLTHEIRTPMNAIVGFSDLIMTTELDENLKREYTSIIHKSGKNLVSIIDDLIEVSRIDSNQIVPNYSLINLDICLQELYETIKINFTEEKKIAFYITKENTTTLTKDIKVDVVKLRQVLTNLITNAIKYTNEGYVTFGYEIEEREECDFIKIQIKDTGVGISAEYHNTIFERFQRIENDKAIEVGGLGLGLAISKAYVEIMGGYITVSSNVPNGSIFTVYIPLKFDKENSETKVDSTAHLVTEKCTKYILVAEDDNINYMLIKKMLEPTGCSIIRAENGEIAVQKCQENEAIHLVLMDIKMPVMNGYEAFEMIKKIKPDLPVIAQTAYSTAEDKERIDDLGFTNYISKPINKEKLLELVKKYF
jgi:signal transduction histidine kinase/CheY-like chemotaxis protein